MLTVRKMDLTHLLGQTIQWNKVACLGSFDFSQERKDLQYKCMIEEVKEYVEATATGNTVEMLDAICDMIFVGVYGYFLEEDGEINLSDFVMDYTKVDLRADGISNPITNGTIFQDLSGEFLKIFTDEEIASVLSRAEIYKLCVTALIGLGLVGNFDLKGAYENVVNSNFTKFPLTEDVQIAKELAWFENKSKYNDVCVEEFDGRFLFRCDGGEGKIVKPRAFCEPKLGGFIHG